MLIRQPLNPENTPPNCRETKRGLRGLFFFFFACSAEMGKEYGRKDWKKDSGQMRRVLKVNFIFYPRIVEKGTVEPVLWRSDSVDLVISSVFTFYYAMTD